MLPYLARYPNKEDAEFLRQGFTNGFRLQFEGPQTSYVSKNHASTTSHASVMQEKIDKEVLLGRILGPFDSPPLPNLRCSAIGLVPKKSDNPDPNSTDNWRFIHDLSTYPKNDSVNSWVADKYAKVEYNSFDEFIDNLAALGPGALMAKADLKSAFRTLPMSPLDFHALGLTFNGKYYVNVCMPMGARVSCATYEKFSTFIQWCIEDVSGKKLVTHYIDDFLFFGAAGTSDCDIMIDAFNFITETFHIPTVLYKSEGSNTVMEALGLLADTQLQLVCVPQDKVILAKDLIATALGHKHNKVTLRELQSLIGSLQFLCRAVAPGRAFIRRLTYLTIGALHPMHHIRLSAGARLDLQMWLHFLMHYNGTTFFRSIQWSTNDNLDLFSDASGWGIGLYFAGRWSFAQWPRPTRLTQSIQLMEIFPIAVALTIWGHHLVNHKVIFHCDNLAVVEALNQQSSRNKDIMAVIRYIVLTTLRHNIVFKCNHVPGVLNIFSDQLSRGRINQFKAECKHADQGPTAIPYHLWSILSNELSL